MAIENEDKVNSEDEASVADEESTTAEAKVQAAPSKFINAAPVLIAVIGTAAIAAFIIAPSNVDELFSSVGDSLSSSNESVARNYPPVSNYRENNQEPQWAAQQRADMEKRHAELKKQNDENRAANMNTSEVPQWVKDQQAQAEQRRQEFEKQNMASNQLAPEPPQWVKDQRAQMQKEQERYQQEWAKRSAAMASNRPPQPPWVTNQPGVNAYPSAQGYQNQMPVYGQNPAPYYNGSVPPANPYYYGNAPYSGPYNAPYGYPYR